jgi:hypothetical protein
MAIPSKKSQSVSTSGNRTDKKAVPKRQEVQFFTRLNPTLREWLKDEVQKLGSVTEKDAFSNILSYLKNSNNPDLIRQVLLGEALPDRAEIGTQYSKALQRIGYGEHAFARRFYSWAYEEFSRVLETAGSQDSGLRMFAHFKAAYCLLEIIYGIRKEALNKLKEGEITQVEWDRYYEAADHCANLALWRYKEVETLGGEHPISSYNRACVWSLKCTLKVERELGPEDKDMAAVAAVQGSGNSSGNPWKGVGQRWRNNIPLERRTMVLEDVAKFTANCFAQLDNLIAYDKDITKDKPLYDIVFIYELAREDSDLDFMKYDKNSMTKFTAIMDNYNASRLDSFEKIRERLPSHLQDNSDLEAIIT